MAAQCDRHAELRVTSPACPRCEVADLRTRLKAAEARAEAAEARTEELKETEYNLSEWLAVVKEDNRDLRARVAKLEELLRWAIPVIASGDGVLLTDEWLADARAALTPGEQTGGGS